MFFWIEASDTCTGGTNSTVCGRETSGGRGGCLSSRMTLFSMVGAEGSQRKKRLMNCSSDIQRFDLFHDDFSFCSFVGLLFTFFVSCCWTGKEKVAGSSVSAYFLITLFRVRLRLPRLLFGTLNKLFELLELWTLSPSLNICWIFTNQI